MHQKPLAVHRTKPHRESTGALSREASSTRSCGRSPLSRLNGEPSFLFMGAGTHACASHFLYGPRISISDTVILVFVKCPVQAKPTGTAQVAPWSSQRRNQSPKGAGMTGSSRMNAAQRPAVQRSASIRHVSGLFVYGKSLSHVERLLSLGGDEVAVRGHGGVCA